jgi:hypothetical protein
MLKNIFIIMICTVISLIYAQDIDVFTPEMIKIKENYIQQKEKLGNARKTELNNLIDSCLAQAENQEKKQKTRGNISAMAAAQKISRVLYKYKTELDEKDDFELSSRTRRETESISDRMAKEKAIIDSKYKELQLEALINAQEIFKNAAMLQQNLSSMSQDKIEKEFEKLTKTAKKESVIETASTSSETNAPAHSMFSNYLASKQDKDILKSGETEHWQPFASIKGAVNTIEIFNIPLADIAETKTFEGMREGNAYKLEYTALGKLNTTTNKPFFMIKNLNSAEEFDVVNWPSRRNNWTLSIRLRPSKTFPSNHRIELKIGGEFLATKDQKLKEKSARLKNVKIQIKSIPDKAYVFIDNRPLIQARRYVLTPCIITIPAGTHNLTIKKSGFEPKIVEDFIPEHKQSYSYVLIKSKNVNESTIKVESKSSWVSSKLSVHKGDKIVFETKGEWSIGKDKEETDYKGYPNNSSFFKYYIEDKYNPSITKSANYGALIAKIGQRGTPFGVSKKPVTADTSGIIYYTANELDASKIDNSGDIYVKTQINPEE